MKRRYRIAENVLEVLVKGAGDLWQRVEWNYEPFLTDCDAAAAVSVELREGSTALPGDAEAIYEDVPPESDQLKLYVYRTADNSLCFRNIQPGDECERTLLRLSPDRRRALLTVEPSEGKDRPWQAVASLTSCIQLAFFFATQGNGTLLSHASSVLKDGRAYLFLGRSGTGKSTHSRLWLDNIAGSVLLNDDHPILRFSEDGRAVAYGSPWSGKTPCYRNLSAPVGAIVRIRRAPANNIRRLTVLEAFASLTPSMFNAPFDRGLTDARHAALERMVATVPCYELHCLPDADAARVCENIVNRKSDQ